MPVRRPHCCMRKRLSLPLLLPPWYAVERDVQSYSLSSVTGSSIAHHSAISRGGEGRRGRSCSWRRPHNGGCAFVTMFTQIFKDNPTISKGLLCNFSSHFIVLAAGNTKKKEEKEKKEKRKRIKTTYSRNK